MSGSPARVADGVHRLGTRLVNWYLVEDGGRVTVVDCGLPAYYDQVEPGLHAIGRSLADVEAIVLTHGDGDHIGFGERLRSETGAPFLVHSADQRLVTSGERKETERGVGPYLLRPAAWPILVEFTRKGGMRPPPVGAVTTYEDGETLDVPGSPRAIHTPGHTNGHCVLHFERSDVLLVGDAIYTWNPLTGRRGAQIGPGPFNVSSERALESLDRVAATGASVLAPGHGDPFTAGAAQAVEEARANGRS